MSEDKFDVDELLTTINDSEAKLKEATETIEKLEQDKKKELAERLAKLTGKEVNHYLGFSEDALKEMISLNKKEISEKATSKGIVADTPVKEEIKEEFLDLKEYKEHGDITMTHEAWVREDKKLRNLDWIGECGFTPSKK